mmetsp:Transcript_8200/g.24442  ORF Transcript_8200/g.24442 Transcript_8200/m.24442 type:complete len:223 (+) Transcript_8200:4118-4786(+)
MQYRHWSNGTRRMSKYLPCLQHNTCSGKQGAVQSQRLVLAPLPTHIAAVLPGEAVQQGLHLCQGAPQMLPRVQPNGSNFDQDCLHAAVNHAAQQGRLGLAPQEGQGGEPQAGAHRLHPQPLVVRCYGPARHPLQPRESLLGEGQQSCEIFHLIACGLHIGHVRVAGCTRDAAAQEGQPCACGISLHQLVAHRLKHPAVQLVRGHIHRQQIAQCNDIVSVVLA